MCDVDPAAIRGRGDAKVGGGVVGTQSLAGVLSVHVGVQRQVEGPDDDRVPIVQVVDVLAVGGSGEG